MPYATGSGSSSVSVGFASLPVNHVPVGAGGQFGTKSIDEIGIPQLMWSGNQTFLTVINGSQLANNTNVRALLLNLSHSDGSGAATIVITPRKDRTQTEPTPIFGMLNNTSNRICVCAFKIRLTMSDTTNGIISSLYLTDAEQIVIENAKTPYSFAVAPNYIREIYKL